MGCYSSPYAFSLDTYPPNSTPHENNWTHSLKIVTRPADGGSFSEKSPKNIWLSVYDKSENILYENKLTLSVYSIDREVDWNSFEEISIELFDRHTAFKGNKVDKSKSYSKHIKTINLVFDSQQKMFVEI